LAQSTSSGGSLFTIGAPPAPLPIGQPQLPIEKSKLKEKLRFARARSLDAFQQGNPSSSQVMNTNRASSLFLIGLSYASPAIACCQAKRYHLVGFLVNPDCTILPYLRIVVVRL
jgi:hypothetical protein